MPARKNDSYVGRKRNRVRWHISARVWTYTFGLPIEKIRGYGAAILELAL